MTDKKQFDFIVDKEKNIITTRREFSANKALVWDCYTKSELLDQWFAPKPFTTKTKHMDFREGGHWHYAMVDPEGKEYWGYTKYKTISARDNYTAEDAFSDEHGTINPELPKSDWNVTFTSMAKNTLVETIVTYASLEELEKVIQMGMQEGLTSTLEKLDELLLRINK